MAKHSNNKEGMGLGIRSLLKGIEEDYKKHQPLSDLTMDGLINNICEIPLEQIEINPYQPRAEFDLIALQELSESIKTHGIIQPLTVRKLTAKKYQLIAGERRLRASKLAGLSTVPVYIHRANDQEMLEIALIENIQREDLNAIEVAITYKRLIDECSLTHEALSERIGKDRSSISNFLRLLKLPPEVQTAIKMRTLSMGHARALAGVDNPIYQLDIYKQVIAKKLSVRQTEELCRNMANKSVIKRPAATTFSPRDIQLAQQNLTQYLSTKVELKSNKDYRGSITINFYSKDDLERLLELIDK